MPQSRWIVLWFVLCASDVARVVCRSSSRDSAPRLRPNASLRRGEDVWSRRLTKSSSCSGAYNATTPIPAVPPIRVGAVDVSVAGQSAEVESEILDVVCGDFSLQHLFLLTLGPGELDGGRVWRSTDAGVTFADMTPLLTAALEEKDATEEENYGVVRIFASRDGSERLFFQGAGHYHWISTDGGYTLSAVDTPGSTTGRDHVVKLHPTQENWALALVEREICDDLSFRLSSECAKDLFLTQDLWETQTWANLTERSGGRIAAFVDFGWGQPTYTAGSREPSKAIRATVYKTAAELKGPYPGWDKDVHYVYSDSFFEKAEKYLAPCGNEFEAVEGVVFLGVSNACPVDVDGRARSSTRTDLWQRGVTLYVSTDGGRRFSEACVPVPMEQYGYSLVVTHDGGGAFVIVHHIERTEQSGVASLRFRSNAYASADNAAVYTQTLPHLRWNPLTQSVDFARIRGLPGAYIANQAIESRSATDDRLFATKVSYNGGVTWERIPAPSSFTYPECNTCDGHRHCFLHLSSAWTLNGQPPAFVYSHDSAPGVLMATGSVGRHGAETRKRCTWLSVDGGVTWRDVALGVYTFEFGDYGGIIAMVRHAADGPAEEVKFSIDEGECWSAVQFETAIDVQNIRIEPDGQRPRFVIHGLECTKGAHPRCSSDLTTGRGVLYTLDVEELLLPGRCDTDDYTIWRPLDNKRSACLLGASVRIEKRRQNAGCLNGGDYARKTYYDQPCSCTDDDKMCDYGYHQVGLAENKTCVPLRHEVPQCELMANGEYVVRSDAKRIVHADKCRELTPPSTLQPEPALHVASVTPEQDVAHSDAAKGSKSGWWIACLVVFCVLAVGAGAFVLYRRKSRASSFDDDEGSPSVVDAVKGAVDWLRTGFRRHGIGMTERENYYLQLN